jgi:K+-transporting ATPase ATPase A chain
MDLGGWLQLGVLVAAVVATTPLLGRFLAGVFGDGPAAGDRVFLPLERTVYRLTGVDPKREQRWTGYAMSLLAFSVVSVIFLFAILRLQASLPFNPDGLPAVPPALAFNTAVSFVSNTNWQNYGGEAVLSHFSQAVGLVTQNFVSAAAGLAVLAALIRGLARRRAETVGNFWVDLTRVTVRVLLPLSVVVALFLVSQGVVQNLNASVMATTVEGAEQAIPGGPAASQVAIKQLGTNGGGFFNTNSSHPFENSNGISNFLEVFSIVAISFGSVSAYGRMVGDKKQGRVILAVMLVLWLGSVGTALWAEDQGNPALTAAGVDQTVGDDSPGGSLEGKEVRFGPYASAVWAASTTSTSNGSVNSMHDSLTPIGGLVTLGNMLMGEISPGGVGVGLTGMLVFVILTVFIAGLIVGRTPEYLGKKIQAAEVKLAVLYVLAMPLVVLGFTAVAVLLPDTLASRANPGPHGFSEILYGFASPGNNNGSAFAGLTGNTPFYNVTQAVAMLVGRFMLIVPVLGLAGTLGRKPVVPESSGTFPTNTPLFGVLLIGVVLIVALLTFFPALALGPIAEALGS